MFSQLSEQVKKSSQPVSDLFAANLKALQAVSSQQASFVSGVFNDSMKMMQTVSQQTEVNGLLAAQSVYVEALRERLTITTKSTLSTLNVVGQQFADTMKTSFEGVATQEVKPLRAAQSVIAQKATRAKRTLSVNKTTSLKKVPIKKNTESAPSKSVAVKAPSSKVTVSAPAAKKPAVKKVTKPLPKLSAPSVRAKTEVKTISESLKVDKLSKA